MSPARGQTTALPRHLARELRPMRCWHITPERVRAIKGRAGAIRWLLESAYRERACFVCGCFRRCEHREPVVELAILETTNA